MPYLLTEAQGRPRAESVNRTLSADKDGASNHDQDRTHGGIIAVAGWV